MRFAITADLHWGHRRGEEATRMLRDYLAEQPPDVLLLAGDVGTGPYFAECLALFADLPCPKALVPGNHDLWVDEDDPRDSLQVYHAHLPRACADHGFHYLDHGPLLLPGANLAVAGTINWYDYSWSLDQLRRQVPDWEERLQTKTLSRGRLNDARFVRWPLDDVRFTAEVVAAFERHLEEALDQLGRALVVTHHPAFAGLSFPSYGPPSPDGLLWAAFAGNTALEAVLARHAARVPFVFSGHTHRARENALGAIRGYNVGGDYHFKRLLLLDWPAGTVEAHTFGDPAGQDR
jgi:3',5'-cyclic AMP phosphodiesterase CpdA